MHPLFDTTRSHPVIAAVRTAADVNTALESNIATIFMIGGNISEVRDITRRVHDAGKYILFHVELVKGLGRDKEAIEFLASEAHPDGVVSTKPHLLGLARKLELVTVLQIFMIDTQAFHTGLRNIKSTKPDAIEIMPGLMPGIIRKLGKQFDLPIFTAGLIKQPEEVEIMLAAGAEALAISEQSLWSYTR